MPKYKGEIARPEHQDIKLKDENGNSAGTIRIKPSGVSFKAPNARKWKTVSMDDMQNFISVNGKETSK